MGVIIGIVLGSVIGGGVLLVLIIRWLISNFMWH